MSLKNKKVLITCGPTWVPIDNTRVISNISTGELGQTLACSLLKKGAKVTVLEGPVRKPLQSKHIRIIKYLFYDELLSLLRKVLRKNFDVIIHAAAVSDYRPKRTLKIKLRSGLKGITLSLVPTQKIIEKIKRLSPKTFLVGFKLEPDKQKILLNNAAQLIKKSGCDLVVANSLSGNNYKAFIINPENQILAKAGSRVTLVRKLIGILGRKL
jgi:phosphopantothenoylcysteine decarboxylase/phosphopantothenate--cysteine ligase